MAKSIKIVHAWTIIIVFTFSRNLNSSRVGEKIQVTKKEVMANQKSCLLSQIWFEDLKLFYNLFVIIVS